VTDIPDSHGNKWEILEPYDIDFEALPSAPDTAVDTADPPQDTADGGDSPVDALEEVAQGDDGVDPDCNPLPPAVLDAGDLPALLNWLQLQEYRCWLGEPSPHPSAGPHFGSVRVWFNPSLEEGLAGGVAPFPVDSVAIKELLGVDGDDVLGWSLARKVASGAGPSTWYWYEWYEGSTFGAGVADPTCSGCHSGGADFILTPLP
jgi:hypothetical protein